MKMDKLLDRAFFLAVLSMTAIAIFPFFVLLFHVIENGIEAILQVGILRFLTSLPPSPGNGMEGVGPAVLGTVIVVGLSTLFSIPISFALSVLFVEFPNSRISKISSVLTDSLLELPSIIVGMLIYVLVVVPMKTPSMIAGSIALTVVSLPIYVTYMRNALLSVPPQYREAGYSIGLKKLQVLLKVMMPIARRGLSLSVVLGIARAMGETDSLIFTVGNVLYYYPKDVAEPGTTLTILIYNFVQTPYGNYIAMAWGAALMIVLFYLLLFAISKLLVKEVRI
ncbi:MAG TPA: ABC transporter permease subunit [Fervidicoccus fontis]|uniref:ABC transporter permease subunit n=1 Tax=Fervidicoccus fontis TaxID=683846 RepID=A0A7C2YRN0_9CREN|nr:ABC transporter permease subunit [Fervidicoccus fontis]